LKYFLYIIYIIGDLAALVIVVSVRSTDPHR